MPLVASRVSTSRGHLTGRERAWIFVYFTSMIVGYNISRFSTVCFDEVGDEHRVSRTPKLKE